MKQVSPHLPLYILLGAMPLLWTWVPRFAPVVLGAAAVASLFLVPRSRWRELFHLTGITWIVLGIVAYAVCSTLWHYDPRLAWTTLPRIASLLVAFWIVLRVQRLLGTNLQKKPFEARLFWIAVGSFLFYAPHLLLFPLFRPFLLSHLEGASAVTHAIYRFSPGGAMITLMIWPVLYVAQSHFPLWKKPFWGKVLTCLFLLLPFLLFFTKADVDSFVVAFVAASVIYLTFPLTPRFVPWFVSGGVIIAAWLAPVVAYHVLSWPKLEPLVKSLPPTWRHRLHIWQFVAEKIYQKPWFGWGFGSARYFPEGDVIPMHPHNFLLQLWLDWGVAAPLFITILMVALWRHTRQYPSCTQVFYAMITAYFTIELFSFSVWQSWLCAMSFISFIFAHRVCVLHTSYKKDAIIVNVLKKAKNA